MSRSDETESAAADASDDPHKLTIVEQIFCGWPLILVVVGGFVGGACGGGAWAINTQIMKGSLPKAVQYALIILTGLAAGLAYFLIVFLLAMIFPDLFKSRV